MAHHDDDELDLPWFNLATRGKLELAGRLDRINHSL